MGDWIIEKLINRAGDADNASLVGKLCICDKAMIPKRLKLVLESIIKEVKDAKEASKGNSAELHAMVTSFLPFAAIFSRTLRIAAETLSSDHEVIDLNVKPETCLDLISLLADIGPNSESSKELREFCVLLIVPPLPFVNKAIDEKFASETLLVAQGDKEPSEYAF